ncbi:hypothetical protein FHN55_04585 [Streptomyces sp. NP160]|uniref:hypothetical protein n=1 Tax=Streptomyces sp. NP160 TaxID=2586637 RepID=UPI0011186732|nr:hypothetical protein [Streptomyces sp. NP160]TNM69077.1 hypothetical protein FHN55_04585 [Streptomyces sp. NP160]
MTQTTSSVLGGDVRDLADDLRDLGVHAAAAAAAGDALAELAGRLRLAAATVEAQAAAHRGLLAVDWTGAAATAFAGLVAVRVVQLERLAADLAGLAGTASRRAAAGDALRAAAGWAS